MIQANAQVDAIRTSAQLLKDRLAPLLHDCGPYAMLDFPNYANVGDSAIYLGQRHLVRELTGCDPDYVSSMRSHSDAGLRHNAGTPLILLTGGGNFGDLWPRHQSFREHILRQYRDCRIVQMPQSIHFQDVSARDACARVIADHTDFTLIVRDHESHALAQAHFDCEVLMCPDGAFGLAPIAPQPPQTRDILLLIRDDHESRFTDQEKEVLSALGASEDWASGSEETRARLDRLIEKLTRKSTRAGSLLRSQRLATYDKWAENRLARGIAQLSAARFILTDRLHVHIIADLLGIPHLVMDNSYGKISNYINAWPKSGLAQVVTDLPTAVRLAREHLQSNAA